MLSVIKVRLAFLSQESMCLKSYTSCTHQLLHATLAGLLSTHTRTAHTSLTSISGLLSCLGIFLNYGQCCGMGQQVKGGACRRVHRLTEQREKGAGQMDEGWVELWILQTVRLKYVNRNVNHCVICILSICFNWMTTLMLCSGSACCCCCCYFCCWQHVNYGGNFDNCQAPGHASRPTGPHPVRVCECVYYGIVQLVLSSRAHKSFPCYPT